MPTVILLSSSPPRIFADPPTQAESPVARSPVHYNRLEAEAHRTEHFNTKDGGRAGSTNGFTTARSFLKDKQGGVNSQVCSPGKGKYKVPLKASRAIQNTGAEGDDSSLSVAQNEVSPHLGLRPLSQAKQLEIPLSCDREVPAAAEVCISRKQDWTPVKDTPIYSPDTDSPTAPGASLFDRLSSNFAFDTQQHLPRKECNGGHMPVKRTRVDLIETASDVPFVQSASPDRKRKRTVKPAVKKAIKSAPKKSLTITGLATTFYHGLDEDGATPMMQYLASTQARLTEDDEIDHVVAEVKALKKVPRKAKAGPKPLRLSPSSVMRRLEGQDIIFGSASQLAREESPTLLRETIEATKLSESFLMSDPVSPQRTQTYSIGSITPRAARGTARYSRTKNLWAAADRDENNALLHVDTVDLSNSPTMCSNFAGTDALSAVSACNKDTPIPCNLPNHNKDGDTRVRHEYVDIDDVITPKTVLAKRGPCIPPRREMHTSAHVQSPRKRIAASSTAVGINVEQVGDTQKISKPEVPKPVAQRPSFAGFATHDLQKQISAYGFKPIKKREKMIELLEKCWDEKHGSRSNTDSAAPEPEDAASLKHGDFLSKVHDISARPVPKPKKPVGRKKKVKDPSDAPEKPVKRSKRPVQGDAGTKASRKRKARTKSDEIADDGSKTTTKPTRKRKTKAKPLSDEKVLDIDEIEQEISAPPSRWQSAVVTSKLLVDSEPQLDTQRPQTPSLSVPGVEMQDSPESEPDLTLPPSNQQAASQSSLSATASSPDSPDIQQQIRRAILNEPTSSGTQQTPRNHQKNPTWHEKILLYDPIVLEDLTTWLNTQGLNAIGEDREVSAMEVREWCEKEGICCLWKGGWRGNRKGNPDGED